MYKRMISWVLIFNALLLSSLHATITPISSFKQLESTWEEIDASTWVIFDVDDVLIVTEDRFMHPSCNDFFMKLVFQALRSAKTDEEADRMEEKISLLLLLPKRVIVEKECVGMIQELQSRGIKTFALTASPVGSFGYISAMERWRIDHLRSLEISFEQSFPEIRRKEFSHLLQPRLRPPLFEEGFLFSYGYKKGDVLKAFLEYVSNFHEITLPSKIVFIDDIRGNLVSVEKGLEAFPIVFEGYHYQGAKAYYKDFDQALLQYQFDHLLETEQWLKDDEVIEYFQLYK